MTPPPLPPEREQGGTILPPETLAAIQRRVDAATEAPWTAEHDQRNEETRIYACGGALRAFLDGRVLMNEHADGEFLAHARQDIPALLAHTTALARQLQEANDRAEEAGEEISRLLALARRVEAAGQIVARLPKTADGVYVIPGDELRHPDWRCPSPIMVTNAHDEQAHEKVRDEYTKQHGESPPDDAEYFAEAYYFEGDTGYLECGVWLVSECYSTQEAVAAARRSTAPAAGEGVGRGE